MTKYIKLVLVLSERSNNIGCVKYGQVGSIFTRVVMHNELEMNVNAYTETTKDKNMLTTASDSSRM